MEIKNIGFPRIQTFWKSEKKGGGRLFDIMGVVPIEGGGLLGCGWFLEEIWCYIYLKVFSIDCENLIWNHFFPLISRKLNSISIFIRPVRPIIGFSALWADWISSAIDAGCKLSQKIRVRFVLCMASLVTITDSQSSGKRSHSPLTVSCKMENRHRVDTDL